MLRWRGSIGFVRFVGLMVNGYLDVVTWSPMLEGRVRHNIGDLSKRGLRVGCCVSCVGNLMHLLS